MYNVKLPTSSLYKVVIVRKDFPSDKTFSQLFQKKVAEYGNNLAAEDEYTKLTYTDLWNETLRIAYWLMHSGTTRGGILPIVMERSCSFLSSVIGIFHIGAAYVPIDPVYPINKIENILKLTDSNIILSEKKFAHIFEKINNTGKVILYYEELTRLNKIDIDKVILSIASGTPKDLSYIIFTSGFTGISKRVMIEQGGMINHLYSKINDLDIKIDKIIQNSSQSFDISVWQNLVCLLTGGGVCIANQEISSDPLKLFQYLQEKNITLLEITPYFLKVLLETNQKFSMERLRCIVVTRETLPSELCREWYKKYGEVTLVNAYGSTECADNVTHYDVPIDLSEHLITAPIGKVINNTQIYILDKNLNVLPEGVAGELCVGGIGVGRGYYKNPRLTSSVFLPDPYSKIPNARLYRTGDLCRSIGNGMYQFISRIDYQVKIRGYSIELGEIEYVIKKFDGIKDCVVWTYGNSPHIKLVAYYTSEQNIEKSRIISYISEKLPGYMIPSTFIKIQSIPVTINGRVDYKSLTEPVTEQDYVYSYVAPDTQLEFEIAEIMSNVLNLDKINVVANFFDIGGNSLSAIQVINKLNYKRNSSVSIKMLFENPSVRELASSIEKNRKHDTHVVEFRKIDRNRGIPVSFGQQQLLLFKKLIPDDTSYNISGGLDLIGNLDVERLISALTMVIERHEILRTVFVEEDGVFYQEIKDFIKIPFTILEDNVTWEAIVTKESRRIFDLSKGPLFNMSLLRLDRNHYRLMIVMHHIISDEWSIKVLNNEISHFYKNKNSLENLPLIEFQYADYADWQKRLLLSGVLDKQLDYWVEKLGNYKDILDLPVDYQRQAEQPANGKVVTYRFDRINKKSIETICEENGITPYVFFISSFGVLLQKYSGMSEVIVGSPVLGRKSSFLDNLIGYFVNTIIIKLDGKDNPSFKDFLASVKLDVIDSLNNQEIPFEKVVEALHPTRSLQQNPLFQVMFWFQNVTTGEIDFPDVKITSLQTHNGTAKFDLLFMIEETKGEYYAVIEFDNNIFSEDTIANMFDCYKTIIDEVYTNQTKKLSEINIVSNKSKQLMLDIWNERELEFPTHQTFSQLFRASSFSYANKVCASDENCSLTYSQVWDQTCKVASRLILEGISPGQPVVVFMERSTKFLIAIIGIFHARAAYVPIDPNYPENRIKQIIDKSNARLMVTEKTLSSSTDYLGGYIPSVYIDDIMENQILKEDKLVETRIDAGKKSDLAYIIFTSGSTGVPKGVMIEQGGMINHLYAKINDLKIEKDVIIQNSSQCFDISVWQNLVCLLTGGKTHIVSHEVSMDPKRLFSTVYSVNATIVEIVPSVLRAALEADENIKTSQLRCLIVTGEVLPNDICKSWYEFHPEIPIINAYGPTECSDDVTHYTVSNDVRNEPIPLPIGIPVNNLKLYVLNSFLMPIPIGGKGELYVGGIGVGRGYINNPRETAKAFIPNPYATTSGERLYRTGDLCRYLPDGRIQYLSRIDQQVKIRGYRIELLEIEITIRKVKDIKDCVVIPNVTNNQSRLICYYTAAEKLEQNLIKRWLLPLLPHYMIPSVFIWMDKLPLTPNGKIDKHSLPESIFNLDDLDEEYIEPITDIERKVAKIMADILEVKRVGLYNNFFDLGGHSLLINKLVMEVEKEFKCKVSFKDIFEEPTVANVSNRINEYMSKKYELIAIIETLEESKVAGLLKRMDNEEIDTIIEELRSNHLTVRENKTTKHLF